MTRMANASTPRSVRRNVTEKRAVTMAVGARAGPANSVRRAGQTASASAMVRAQRRVKTRSAATTDAEAHAGPVRTTRAALRQGNASRTIASLTVASRSAVMTAVGGHAAAAPPQRAALRASVSSSKKRAVQRSRHPGRAPLKKHQGQTQERSQTPPGAAQRAMASRPTPPLTQGRRGS